MGLITRAKEWIDNEKLNYNDLNGEIDTIVTLVNGNIEAANLADISSAPVGESDTQTLSSKTLTKPTINGSVQAYTTDSDGATVTFNLAASNNHTVTLGGNRTLALSNSSVGQAFLIRLAQDGTGSRTVTWWSTIKWPGGSAPTLSTAAGAVDSFVFICTSSGNYDGYFAGFGLS